MKDGSAEVRQFAVAGLAKSPALSALPLLLEGLSGPDASVRASSARTTGRFGRAATGVLQELEAALSRESVARVRFEIQNAIATIQKQ